MQTALDLWPTVASILWAYPFIAIPHMRRRRLIMDLAQIGHDEEIRSLAEAQQVLRAIILRAAELGREE